MRVRRINLYFFAGYSARIYNTDPSMMPLPQTKIFLFGITARTARSETAALKVCGWCILNANSAHHRHGQTFICTHRNDETETVRRH